MAKHICLLGSPGTGKSTIASGLFYEMKVRDCIVELVSEYAKSLVFSKDFYKIKDQLYILAKQSHPWFKMDSQLDFTINDGPFILGLLYLQESPHLPKEQFKKLLISMYKSYDTVNILLTMNDRNTYEESGRYQNREESLLLQEELRTMLKENDIEFHEIVSSENSIREILTLLGL